MPTLFLSQVPMEVSEGEDVSMEVPTRHLQSPNVHWTKDDEPLGPAPNRLYPTSPGHTTLLIKSVAPQDSGVYTCVVSSEKGTITKKFLVNIEGETCVVKIGQDLVLSALPTNQEQQPIFTP